MRPSPRPASAEVAALRKVLRALHRRAVEQRGQVVGQHDLGRDRDLAEQLAYRGWCESPTPAIWGAPLLRWPCFRFLRRPSASYPMLGINLFTERRSYLDLR